MNFAYASSASSIPSSHGSSFFAQWSVCRTTGTYGEAKVSVLGAILVEGSAYTVDGSDRADVVGGSDSSCDGCFLVLVVDCGLSGTGPQLEHFGSYIPPLPAK